MPLTLLAILLLLQQLPGTTFDVPITEVRRQGRYLVGQATNLDGKPDQQVYLFHGRLREFSPGIVPYIASFRESDLEQSFSIVEPGELIAKAPVRDGRFRMDLSNLKLPKKDLVMGVLYGDSVHVYPTDFAERVNRVPPSWAGRDLLWLRIGMPLIGLVAVLTVWLVRGWKRAEGDGANAPGE